MTGERDDRSFTEALFFGALEVSSFVFLFLSPFLLGSDVEQGWYALVAWRIVCLGGVFYLGLHQGVVERLALASRKALYGVPFWASSLLFPLRAGQEQAVSRALVLYVALLLVLLLLSSLRTHWYPGLCASLTFLALHQSPEPERLWPSLLPLTVALWPRTAGPTRLPEGQARALVFVSTGGWGLALYFSMVGDSLGLRQVAQALVVWVAAVAMSYDILTAARREGESRAGQREAELSLPDLEGALLWRYSRRWLQLWLPWAVLLPLSLWSWDGVLLGAVLFCTLPGLLARATDEVGESTLPWWVCWQFVLFWATVESHGKARLVWMPVALLVSLYLSLRTRAGRPPLDPAIYPDQVGLEALLRSSLRHAAPSHLKGDVLAGLEPSVDIDRSLSATAPTGFRERLLERLRRDPVDEED